MAAKNSASSSRTKYMAAKNSASSSRTGKDPLKYSEMRKSHKRKFCIGGSVDNYIDTIYWLRVMCSCEGSTFKGIPSLNSRGYPLVQIKVITSENKFAKFIIRKEDLYLIAFTSSSEVAAKRKGSSKAKVNSKSWFQFETGDKIDDWEIMNGYDGRYSNSNSIRTFDNVGRDCMSNAVNTLNSKKSSQQSNAVACEVFFLHLCEAARFRPIEFMVCKSLSRVPAGGSHFPFVWSGINNEEEENHLLSPGDTDNSVSIEKDIYSLFEAAGDPPSTLTKQGSDYVGKLVKNYSNLSQIWYAYSFNGKKMVFGKSDQQMLSDLYMRCVKSVRFTVAVLCRLNVNKLLLALEGEVKEGKVSNQDYKKIESKIKELRTSQEI